MRKNYYTVGEIIKVMPGTVDQGSVYDQNIILELKNGLNLELFDYKMLITTDMVGYRKKIIIKIFDSVFSEKYRRKKISMQEKRIFYDKGYEIYGEVIDKTVGINEITTEEDCIVDSGAGYMQLTTKIGEFIVGDIIYVHASRLDIVYVFA